MDEVPEPKTEAGKRKVRSLVRRLLVESSREVLKIAPTLKKAEENLI